MLHSKENVAWQVLSCRFTKSEKLGVMADTDYGK